MIARWICPLLLGGTLTAQAPGRSGSFDWGAALANETLVATLEPATWSGASLAITGAASHDARLHSYLGVGWRLYPTVVRPDDPTRRLTFFVGIGVGLVRGQDDFVCVQSPCPGPRYRHQAGLALESAVRLQPYADGPFLDVGARRLPALYGAQTRLLIATGVGW